MTKKFKEDRGSGLEAPKIGLDVSIQGYVWKYAPELLSSHPFMENTPALVFWVRTFRPQVKVLEEKREVKQAVVWPYADRIIFLARRFLALSEREQSYICRAAKVNVWWCGDDINHFRETVEETMLFRKLSLEQKDDYKKRIFEIAKTLGRRHALAKAR